MILDCSAEAVSHYMTLLVAVHCYHFWSAVKQHHIIQLLRTTNKTLTNHY